MAKRICRKSLICGAYARGVPRFQAGSKCCEPALKRHKLRIVRHRVCGLKIGGDEYMTRQRRAQKARTIVSWSLMAIVVSAQALGARLQTSRRAHRRPKGMLDSRRQSLGQLPQTPLFWHLVNYPTRAGAEAAKGPRGTVFEAFGKIWLSTIAEAGWQAPRGAMRVAEVGPIPGISNEAYTAITRNRAILWASQQIYTDMTGLNFFIPWPGNYVWKPLMA